MARGIFGGVLLVAIALFLSGCVPLLAGAGGTALWQAGKIISEENASLAQAVSAAEGAFKAEKIRLVEKVSKKKVTQLRGNNQANQKVAVDIFDKGPESVKLEIRIGLGEETASRNLLKEIKKRL